MPLQSWPHRNHIPVDARRHRSRTRDPFEPLVCVTVIRTRSRNKAAAHGALHTITGTYLPVLHSVCTLVLTICQELVSEVCRLRRSGENSHAAFGGCRGCYAYRLGARPDDQAFFRVGSLQLTPLRLRLANATMG